MTSALALCRTPFQAYLLDRVLEAEKVSEFELLYYTHQDAAEDRHYFKQLADKAARSDYVHVLPKRYDILGYLELSRRAKPFTRDLGRDIVLLASIDNYLFSAIARQQRTSLLVTFDDGMSNILNNGLYRRAPVGVRDKLYRIFFGAYDMTQIRDRISRHYTVHPAFENIVPTGKLRTIRSSESSHYINNGVTVVRTFFIGQPFQEVLSAAQINRLKKVLSKMQIDFYVRHPRETSPLELGIPILEKQGLIAEEAIISAARGCGVHVIGWFSNVMFNLGDDVRRTVLLLSDMDKSPEMANLAHKAGCEVIFA